MMQLKAIFSELLREFEFELLEPADRYRNDHSKMVVQLEQPCRARYRRKTKRVVDAPRASANTQDKVALREDEMRIAVDLDLCQGHQVCIGEAPEVFGIERIDGADKVVLKTATVGDELRSRVELAVQHCPTRALRIESGR